ncbi:MAG: diacylglycerol kinase family protein [Ktedonobacterales bacterium]
MTQAQPEDRRNSPVVLIVSPHGGHAHSVNAHELLREAGVAVAIELNVNQLDHLLPSGQEWRARGIAAAVAAGGDGTIGAVATQIAASGLPLGILPTGTSNDVARALGIPMDLDRAAAIIASGTPRPIDSGVCLPAATEPLSQQVGHHAVAQAPAGSLASHGASFLHALTLGLNVEFARLATDIARRRRLGPLNYAAAALEAIVHAQVLPVTLRLAGVRLASAGGAPPNVAGELVVTHHALQVAVVNLPVFGGALGLRLPDVRENDDLLDIVVFEALEDLALRATVEHWLAALRHVPEAREGDHPLDAVEGSAPERLTTLPGVIRYQAHRVVIETPEPVDVTLDGELRAHTPVVVRVAPEPLRIILPTDESK